MKTADNARSVFRLEYGDGTEFVSKPCEHLSEAIVQSGRSYPPETADFWWGDILNHCTTMSIIRAMTEASDRIQYQIAA